MTSKTFQVPGINCGHCVMSIEREVGELEGVVSVKAAADTKMVSIEWNEPASWEGIQALLEEINFPPEG